MWSLGISLTQLLDGKRKGVMRWVGSKHASCIDGNPSFHTLWWLSYILKLVYRACSCQLLFVSFEISSQWWNNKYSMLRVVVNSSLILDLFVLATGADRKPGSGWRNKLLTMTALRFSSMLCCLRHHTGECFNWRPTGMLVLSSSMVYMAAASNIWPHTRKRKTSLSTNGKVAVCHPFIVYYLIQASQALAFPVNK